jgi:hypothetical protein
MKRIRPPARPGAGAGLLRADTAQEIEGVSSWPGYYIALSIPDTAGVGATFQQQPLPGACDTEYAQSLAPGGLQVALADGSCLSVNSSISGSTWRNALLPDDGQALGADW